ncbi:MAG TPA: SRPBCC family protein [Vicinamibacterales bacterium]
MNATVTDRIEKQAVLRAPRSRVWRALTNHEEFGQWFQVRLDGPFREGATVRGPITHPGYEHVTMEVLVERIQPESYFAYRWHPYAVDPKTDYSAEPMTLVEFRLEDAAGGTVLTIVESGFDRVPLARRAEAFRMNEGGWTGQIKNIERHVTA